MTGCWHFLLVAIWCAAICLAPLERGRADGPVAKAAPADRRAIRAALALGARYLVSPPYGCEQVACRGITAHSVDRA